MEYSQRKLSDPRALQALAHPARIAIVEQLTINGPMTASQLADRIDESPANCSWHLRKLAEHGFIEEAGGGTGRERPWRTTTMGLSWDDYGVSGELAVAGEALSRLVMDREVDRLQGAHARLRGDSEQWRAAASVNQSALWLTAEELADLNEKVRALFLSKIERHEDPKSRPAGSRLCFLVQWGMPTYGMADPTPTPDKQEQ